MRIFLCTDLPLLHQIQQGLVTSHAVGRLHVRNAGACEGAGAAVCGARVEVCAQPSAAGRAAIGADCTAVSAAAGSKDIMLHCRTTLHDKLARQSSLHVESSKSAHLLGSVPVTVSQPFVSSSGRQVV